MREELPLQELFTRLREAGLPLGLNDYQAAVKALQGGYGVGDRAALERVCRMLWVRSEDEGSVFDYCFAEVMDGKAMRSLPGSDHLTTRENNQNTFDLDLWQRNIRWTLSVLLFGTVAWVAVSLFTPNINQQPQVQLSPSTPPVSKEPSPSPSEKVQKPKQSRENEALIFLLMQLLAGSLAWLGIILLIRQIKKLRRSDLGYDLKPPPNLTQKNLPKQLLNDANDEIQIAKAIRKSERDRNSNAGGLIDYLPVTQRQMKQSWRYLRRFVREGVATELDVESTIRHIAQNGMLLNPVLVPPRRNQTELLLLIDQDGSMVAFHSLSVRLVETASRGGRLGDADVYYFHNCPIDYLYHDPKHQQAEPLANWFGQVSRSRSVVLIFSDAGAARGGANPKRIEATEKFLLELRQQVRYVAWLNPMPKARWEGTSAAAIAQLTPMFEISRQGMDGAISALRGRGRLGL